MSDVTRILAQSEPGDSQAAEQLLPLVYDELRRLAAAKLTQERSDQTLEATALVHEAYLRLAGGRECRTFQNRVTNDDIPDGRITCSCRVRFPPCRLTIGLAYVIFTLRLSFCGSVAAARGSTRLNCPTYERRNIRVPLQQGKR